MLTNKFQSLLQKIILTLDHLNDRLAGYQSNRKLARVHLLIHNSLVEWEKILKLKL